MDGITGSESGLLGYWPLDEGEGAVASDHSGNNVHAELVDTSWVESPVTFGEYSRFGLSFLAMPALAITGPETDFLRTSYRFHWLPNQNQIRIDPPVSGVLVGGPSSMLDLTTIPNAPQFTPGATYTFELEGNYDESGGIYLLGILSDGEGGEAEITHYIPSPSSGNWFGFSARMPEQQTAFHWHTFEIVPEQFDSPPVEGDTFADWRTDVFEGADATNDEISGPLANPSGDGIVNLLKYAFGLDPLTAVGSAALPQPEVVDGVLRLTYPERIDAADLVYQPQMSIDLIGWNGGAGHVQQIGVPVEADGFRWVTVEAVLPEGTERAFLRVNVVGSP